jgi:hypothetical protein
VRGIETELGGLRGELMDDDAPATLDRVKEIENGSIDFGSRLNAIQHGLDQGAGMAMSKAENVETPAMSARSEVVLPTIRIGN